MDPSAQCSGFFTPSAQDTISCLDQFQSSGGLSWFFGNILEAFFNFFYALFHIQDWLGWVVWTNSTEDKQALVRFIYFGASTELLFVVIILALIALGVGMRYRPVMWSYVRGLEAMANTTGRFFAWSGVVMVLVQVIIIFMQRIFAVSEISLGFGFTMSFDVSWWSESLKFYNALIVVFCVSYTFVQGGHVRVDLVYAKVSYRTKRVIDMVGSVLFMLPLGLVIWLYSWFFMWRHMVVPNISASDTLDRLLLKSRALRWNVETVGFSPNGFNAYFLFKVILVIFAALLMLHAFAFFCRSWLERAEGEAAENKYHDKDKTGDATADLIAEIH